MYAIRCAYPDAHLLVISSPGKKGMPGAKELLENAPWIDELFVYYSESIKGFSKKIKFILDLRKRSINVFFDLSHTLASFSTLLRNLVTIKLSKVSWARGWKLSTLKLWPQIQSESLHFPNEVDRLLKLVNQWGISTENASYPAITSKEDNSFSLRTLSSQIEKYKAIAAIAPGSKRSTNRWITHRFSIVAQYLLKQGIGIVFIGGKSDFPMCTEINKECNDMGMIIAGSASLPQSAAILQHCSFLIACDSGVQHIASAVGTPCISLFSARDIKDKWSPYGDNNIVIRKWPKCHTCFLEACPHDNLCMKMISIKDVLRAINEQVKEI
jgi:ADP-heptose:LPS heptosyltransferase